MREDKILEWNGMGGGFNLIQLLGTFREEERHCAKSYDRAYITCEESDRTS